ncbi:hypothetical protein GCM10009596_29380 [Arthrobacter rhombi]|uniref:hypothetical protein n=1 Tax=Arthrobacter rhombi TaxID=71253 RepID=UPI0031D58CC1
MNPGKGKLRDPYESAERRWPAEEASQAVALYRSGKSIIQIAGIMGIDQKQVSICLIRTLFNFTGEIDDVRASPRNGKRYTDEEISKMESYFDAGVQVQEIAIELQRTVLGVGRRMIDRRML